MGCGMDRNKNNKKGNNSKINFPYTKKRNFNNANDTGNKVHVVKGKEQDMQRERM